MTLRTQFETLRMTESENVDQFMTRVMGIVNQIRLTGEAITDQKQIIYDSRKTDNTLICRSIPNGKC
jgi:hypothetical protein